MKRFLGVLLLITMLSGICVPFTALAAQGEENVLFFTDFESDAIGEKPPSGKGGFDAMTIKETACLFVEKDADGNTVLRGFHGDPKEPDAKARSPRVEKFVYTQGLTNLKVAYDVRYNGQSSTQLVFRDTDTNATLGTIRFKGVDFQKWRHVEIVLNLKDGTAQTYIDGKAEGDIVNVDFAGVACVAVRFSATVELDGSHVLLDNIKLSTTDKDYANVASKREDTLPTTPYKEADAKPESGNVQTILNADLENSALDRSVDVDTNGGFTARVSNDAARMFVEKDSVGDNRMLRAYHGTPDAEGAEARSPRVERMVLKAGLKNLTIDYDVKSNLGASILTLYLMHPTENTPYIKFKIPYNFLNWTHIKVRCDFVTGKAEIYVAGRLHSTCDLPNIDAESFRVRWGASVQPEDSWIALDNLRITTPDMDAGGLFGVTGTTVRWEQLEVAEADKTGMNAVMRKSHPRIYVTDWQNIKDKVASDAEVKVWYDTVINHAQRYLSKMPTTYLRDSKNSLNGASTTFKDNTVPLAAAYCLTGDVRYKNRLYQELEAVGNWPDWGADAFLSTAHILYTYALCYDWLYNDWTAQERENILSWVRDKGFKESVLFYEGLGAGTQWVQGRNNWNNVCNGANIVAAIAFADELPVVSDYIFAHAAEGLPYSFQEISEDGAYAEPLSYWDYGVRYQVKLMAALDSALAEGESLPACLDFKNVRGLENTCDFPIYYNGSVEAFNYGDGYRTLVNTPIMYWLASKYNKPQYAWYAKNFADMYPQTEPTNEMDSVFSMLWYQPAFAQESTLPLDKFYQSKAQYGANGISMRSSFEDANALVVMAHAGDATASHASLDAGGFVLDWAGKRWAHIYGRTPVAGVNPYAWPGYQSQNEQGGRFDYYHTRGEANNTIIANPQKDMPDMYYQYFAEVERCESGENTAYGIINMTSTNKDYASAKRGFMLTGNRDVLIVQDEIAANKPSEFYWFVNTNAEITLAQDGKSALWEMDGDHMLVRITQGPADAVFGIMATKPLATSPDPEIQAEIDEHKMFIHMTNQSSLKLTVEFVPLQNGEGIPAPMPLVALVDWNVRADSAKTTSQTLGNVVALMVDNPNAYAKGAKTYVDTNNLEIMPIVQNGRTLVPVRFIAEKFGALVGWDDATQTVSVRTNTSEISLQIGSTQMYVNGQPIVLDVPAQTIGGRTLIPLRALVEALGKQVFWDDRGLILITDAPVNYDADKIDKIVALLDVRVQADGKELPFFDSEVYHYNVEIAKGATVPTISVLSNRAVNVAQGNPAMVSIGDKTYQFTFVENPFEGIRGTGAADVVKTLDVQIERNNGAQANYQTYLSIAMATSSIEWDEKYPMNGSYDGVISENTQNRWSAEGMGNWICYDFGTVQKLHSVSIAGYKALSRSYKYDIEVSTDNVNFTPVCTVQTPEGAEHAVFALGGVQARYVRLTCTEASNSKWAGISEIRFYDSAQMEKDDQATWTENLYKDSIYALVGASVQLRVRGKNAQGQEIALDGARLKYTSANPAVATVEADGKITIVGAGATEILVEYAEMNYNIKKKISVVAD